MSDPTVDKGSLEFGARRVSQVITYAVSQMRLIGAGRYAVVMRGAVDWPNFPFDQYPRAAAVIADECSLLRRQIPLRLTLEIMTKMRVGADRPDDDVLDQMRSDTVKLFIALANSTNTRDPIDPHLPLLLMVDNTQDTSLEVSDALYGIQGLVTTVPLKI